MTTKPLRILMLAPEPFFEPRGTPFSEYHRIKALGELGYLIDLVTYPFGTDVDLPNLRIIRSVRPPLVRRVPIGPSGVKLLLDALLAVTALRQARREQYDAIHSHEEAGVLGVWLARRMGIPHLYDMHSSLPQQLSNFRYARSPLLRRLFERVERHMIDGSAVVVTICRELQETVSRLGAGERSILIENAMGGEVEARPGPGREALRRQWGITPAQPLILYTGTFEPYQGLDLLTRAACELSVTHPDACVMVVGGASEQVSAAQEVAARLGAPMVFTGRRPPHEIPWFIDASDILASPRIAGTNTPLKIYSYLRSGRPIVATDLLTHTQVLTPDIAVLVVPEPGAFAAALARLIDDRPARARLAAGAMMLADRRFGRAAYLARTREAYARLIGRHAAVQTEAADVASGAGAPETRLR